MGYIKNTYSKMTKYDSSPVKKCIIKDYDKTELLVNRNLYV